MTPLLKPQRGYTGSDFSYALSIDDEQAASVYSSLSTERSELARQAKLDVLESWAKDKIARDAEREEADFDRMYNDLPGWWKETGDDVVDEEVKLRTANRKFIASQFGSTPEDQMDLYPSFRDQWTLANFGKKDLSESETFNMIRDSINGRKQINESIDMITGDVALALFDQADKGKPVDVSSIVSKWKEENADLLSSLPDGWEPNLLKSAGEYYADAEKLMRDNGDVIQRLYAHMVKATGREVEGAPENAPETQEDVMAMIDELAALPQDVRDRAKTAILMAAKRQGMEDKTFGEMAGEAWVRSLNMVRTTGLVAQELEAQQRVDMLKDVAPVYVFPGGVLGKEPTMAGMPGDMPRAGVKLSAEERATRRAEAEHEVARLNVIRELRDFADNRFDPIKANAKTGVGQFFQNVALLGPQSLAYTAMAAVPVAGPVLTGAAIFSEEYNQLRNEGFQPDQAKTLAAVSAPIQTAAEVFGAKLIFGRYKWYRDVIQKMVNPARFARTAQGTVSFFGKVVGENATEATQDLTTPIVQDLASRLSEDYPEVDWQDTLSKFADSRLEVFAATLMPIIGGHTVDVWTDNKRFKSYDMRDKLMYSRLGFTQEEKAYVEDATTPREMSQRYAEVVKNMPAERVNATKESIAAEAKVAADTQLDPTTPTIETARAEDGRLEYIIRDETGQEVFRTFDQAGAEEAYMLTTAKSTAAKLQADRIATKDLVEWWTSQDENNVAREETTRTAQQELERLQGLGDAAGIETLHRRISQLPASATAGMVGPGMDYSQLNILGTATLETVAEGVFRGVIALNESSRPKDALEEINHVFVRRAKAQGRVNDNQLREWITATEAVTGEAYAKDTFDDIVESMAVIAEAYAAQRIDQNAESQLPSSFVDYLKRLVQVLKEVLTRGMALRQGFADGTLGNDYEQFLAESVGLAEQTQVDRARTNTEQAVGANENYSISLNQPDARGFNETALPDGTVRFLAFHGSEKSLANIEDKPMYVSSLSDGAGYGSPNQVVVQGRFLSVDELPAFAAKYGIAMDDLFHEEASMERDLQEALRSEGYDGAIYYDQRRDDGDVMPAALIVNSKAVSFAPKQDYSIGALGNNDPYLPLKTSGGKYKGAPKWVNAAKTQAGRDAAYKRLRERLYELVREGAPGRYWYEDSGRAVLRMFNNDVVEAEKFIELLAIYSPQATVEVNTYFALRAYIQRAVNAAKEEFSVKTGTQDDKAKAVLYDNEPWAGRKTDNFYKNIMYVLLKELPAEEVAKLKLDPETYAEIQKPVTVDMWVYRAFGFDSDALTDVAGTGAFGFSERELNRIAEEMNAMLPEGEDPYLPHQIQAMLWTAIKARAETKEVKDLTEAQSMRAGDMKKVKNEQGKLVRVFLAKNYINNASIMREAAKSLIKAGEATETKDADGKLAYTFSTPEAQAKFDKKRTSLAEREAQRSHMARWTKNALDLPSEKLDVSMAAGAFDRFINSVSMRALWESVPSTNTAEGAAITKLSTAEKAAFTRQSRDIILDENGNDMLASMLGVPINVSQLLSGGYGTGATPNVVTELFPNKPSGTYDDDTVRAYARAIQYIYRQDAVPWMRYIKFGAHNDKSYYAQSPKGAKRRFTSQAEAEAYAADKPGYVVKGDAENFALKLDFGEQLTPDFLDKLQQGLVKLHEYLGFTQVSPTEVIIANFRDADTGLPALTDEDFYQKLSTEYGSQADIQELHTVGEYGPVHDWAADPEGGTILSASSRFTPDLLQWLRGRREVSDAFQKEWAEGRGVTNYSIAAQPEIDRVVNALGTLDRDPLERIKVYEKAQQKFLQVMADNREALATMKMEGATGREIRRTKMLQAMGELDGLLSALPAEVRAKVGGYTTLATIGQGDAALAKFFIKRIEMIDRALERFLRDEYNAAAVELFRRARPQRDAPGEKPKGKLDPDVHDLFNTLKEATEWSAEQAAAYATSQIDRAESGELNPSQAAHAFLVANTVELFADWENADSTQRAAAVNAGKEIFNRAYKANKQKLIAQRQKRAYDRTDLSDDAGVSAEDEAARQTRMKKDNSLPKKWENVSLNLVNFGQLMGYIFGPDSKVAQQLTDRQRKADNAKSDDIAKLSGEWDAFLAKIGKSTAGGHMLLFNMSRMDKQIDGIPYSQNQLMAITMMWMQPKGRQHMEGYMDSDGQPAGKWHYNQDFVNKAERQLSPEAKQIRDYLLRKYAEEYDSINKVYRKLYNINLPQNAFYSPLVVESIRASSNAGVDPVTGAVFAPNANSPGALRSRGGAIAQPVFRDAVQTYFAHMLQMAHWKAYAEFNSEVAGVLGHRDTRMVVKGKAGEQAARVMGNWLDYFNMGGNKDAANQLAINEFLNRMTGNFATMALFGRVSTLALQITQLGAASAKMPTGAYLLRFGKLLSGQLSWRAALDSDYIQRRIKDMPPAVALAMQGLRAEKPNMIRNAARALGQLISGFDGLATAGTYAMVYDYQLSQANKNGLAGQEAKEYAREATERIVDEIAQPTRAGTRSIYELNMTHPIARAAWAFSSESRKNLGLVLAANSGRDLSKALVYVVLLNGLVGGLIRSAFRDIKDDDDEELFDEKHWGWNRLAAMFISDPFYGFPIIGESAESAVYNALGVYKPSGPMFDLAPGVPAAKRLAYDYPSGEKEPEFRDIVRDVNRVLSTAGLFNSQIAAAASLSNLVKDVYEGVEANLPQE